MALHVALLYSSLGREVDGVLDYSRQQVRALRDCDGVTAATLVDKRGRSSWVIDDAGSPCNASGAMEHLLDADAVVVQYSPFGHGRWGFAPWLLRLVSGLTPTVRVAVMVHEPYLVGSGVRDAPISWLQRRQLSRLLGHADVAFSSIEPWVSVVAEAAPDVPVRHLPVASNLPPSELDAAAARAALGIAPDDLVLATMSSGHDSRSERHIVEAASSALTAGLSPVLLDLGAGARGFDELPAEVRAVRPGYLEAPQLSDYLAAADLYLAPLVDGVSTRRTSVMAALAAGVAVVGTKGHLTDAQLLVAGTPMKLVDVSGSSHEFAEAVLSLGGDRPQMVSLGQRGRAMYEARYAGEVTAAALVAALRRPQLR